jgi:hypothetical protein
MLLRHEDAAMARSFSVRSTCTNFSAAAKVSGPTLGPNAGAVANAGGVPAVGWWAFAAALDSLAVGCSATAAAEASIAVDVTRNSRRDFDTSALQEG